MNIRIWGTRGSLPSPGPSTAIYGGNTSCVEVRLADGGLIVLDAGTGIRGLGAALGSCRGTLLLTHYHWDHIQGMPFFSPSYVEESEIVLYGPEFEGAGPDSYLAAQMMTPYFPAAPSQMRGIERYERTSTEPIAIGSAQVCAGRVCHPGVTFGYRIEEAGASLVYMSDDEPALASPAQLRDIVDLAGGADLLIHDCQYTDGEYACRRGWGHSTPEQAVRVAREAGVRRLMLFHHDPGHSDEQVEAVAEEARRIAGDIEILIGQEGLEIDPASEAPEIPRVLPRRLAR